MLTRRAEMCESAEWSEERLGIRDWRSLRDFKEARLRKEVGPFCLCNPIEGVDIFDIDFGVDSD